MKTLHARNGLAPSLSNVMDFLEESIPVLRNIPNNSFVGYKIVVWNAQGDVVLQVRDNTPVVIDEKIVDSNIFRSQYLFETAGLIRTELRELAESLLKMQNKQDGDYVESTMHQLKEKILTANELVRYACQDVSKR